MQKKILLAVDGSTPSRQAVDYAGRMNNLIQGLGVTLFISSRRSPNFCWTKLSAAARPRPN